MNALLKASGLIDKFSERIGGTVIWLVLAAVLISAGNAIVRKAFNTSSNALLEIQWYLFSTVFMLGAGYAFLKNAHVRIDFISSHLSPARCCCSRSSRTRCWARAPRCSGSSTQRSRSAQH